MKLLLKPFLLVLLLTYSLTSLALELQVQNPYVRAVPPGAPVTAAFMELHNQGSEQRTLVAASSPASEVVELHTHTLVDGVMQMRRVESIKVPAQGTTLLQPGGLHLMLINLKETLTPGSQIEITLSLDDGSQIELSLPVRKTQMQPMSNHQ